MSSIENNGLTYVTIDLTEATELNFSQIEQTSLDTLRTNSEGTKTIIKWLTSNGIPSSVELLATKGPYMTHLEALALMSTIEWSDNIPRI